MDFTKVNGYSETLCNVISQIVQSELNKIKCDKTIKCNITDDALANYNTYKVSDGTVEFTVYSAKGESYKKGDSVFITIPNGDYNEQKFIMGRGYDEDSSDRHYNPFDDFISISSASWAFGLGIKANEKIKEKTIFEKTTFLNSLGIGENDILKGSDITHLAISANFSTALPTCRTGVFGLKIELIYKTPSKQVKTHIAYFISPDMYGNIYQLKGTTQKFILNLNDLDIAEMTELKISLYQQGDFFDSAKNYIKVGETNNITLNYLTIEAGYAKSVLSNDTIIVSANTDKTYVDSNDNLGPIKWVFVVKDGNGEWHRVQANQLSTISGRIFGSTILLYDAAYKAPDGAEIATDLWKEIINAIKLNPCIEGFRGDKNASERGIQIVLYEQLGAEKKILERKKIMFKKRKEEEI